MLSVFSNPKIFSVTCSVAAAGRCISYFSALTANALLSQDKVINVLQLCGQVSEVRSCVKVEEAVLGSRP